MIKLKNNLFKTADQKRAISKIKTSEKIKTDDLDKKWLVCSICNNRITKNINKIEINSSHEHTFTNPHGILYIIRCFNGAPGCYTIGFSTNDFTWFPGYSWEVSICSNCKVHNGWKYTKGASVFYGIIKELLVQEK
ncbi:MAG: hypothetical protein JXB50_15840 [Spirochaetes bacterium]|nr:hypothetical protein [Spirochaetota bacterium]